GDVVRHAGPFRRLGALGDQDEYVRAVGRQLEIGRRLTIGQLQLRQRARLVLVFGLLLFFRLDARVLDQLLLFVLHELLAVGLAGIALLRLHIGELDDLAAVDRHQEEVVVANEGDGAFASRPSRVRLVAGGPRDVAANAGHRIEQGNEPNPRWARRE